MEPGLGITYVTLLEPGCWIRISYLILLDSEKARVAWGMGVEEGAAWGCIFIGSVGSPPKILFFGK